MANQINQVLDDVTEEFFRATQKFPTWPIDPLHALAVVGEEFGELTQATLQQVYEPHKNEIDSVKDEAIQTMAMLLRFLLSLEDYKFSKAQQRSQVVVAE